MPQITLGQKTVAYTIRESTRARYVNFRIHVETGLEVVVPSGAHIPNLESLIQQRQSWILKHLRRLETSQPKTERAFHTGDILLYLGEEYALDLVSAPRQKRVSVARQGQHIRVRFPSTPPHNAVAVQSGLESWYRSQAKRFLIPRTTEIASELGWVFGKITIRGQKTRWGSCSSKGNLNFNWRLMMTPPDAIDYVIIHELCHLHELNHSKRFWALVETHCPNYRYWRRWLKENSARFYL